MANQYLTSHLLAKEAVAISSNVATLLPTAYRKYEGMYTKKTYAPGNTIDLRLDNYFIGQRGDTVTAEDIVAATIPLTIAPLYSVPIAYYPTDLQRDIVDFSDEILAPAVRRLIAMMNGDMALSALTQINFWQGDTSSPINTFTSADAVNPLMTKLGMDAGYRRYMALSPDDMHALRSSSSLQNSFISPLNKEITLEAQVTRLAGFDMLAETQIINFYGGTKNILGGQTAFSLVAYTTNTITIGNAVNGEQTFTAGDIVYLPNTQAFNPVTRQGTGYPMPFAIVQTPALTSGNQVTVTVYPNFVLSGPRQNVATIPAINDPIAAVANHTANIAYTERGLVAAIPPLERMDSPESYTFTHPKTGVSMRISKTAEVLNNKNIMRLDAQMAHTWVPYQAVRKVSQVNQGIS